MSFAHLAAAGLSDTGRVRSNNEDALVCLPECGVFAVADGMGGAAAGEVASGMVVAAVQGAFDGNAAAAEGPLVRERRLTAAVNHASRNIRDYADSALLTGTGTTAVFLLFDPWDPAKARVLHAGDSRTYLFRDGKLQCLTTDHSVAAAAGVRDEKDLPVIFRGVLTRAVGLERETPLDAAGVDVRPDDLFLLCSDGLYKMLKDKEITKILRKGAELPPAALAAALVAAANDAGGKDNVSAVIVRVPAELPPPAAPSDAERAADAAPPPDPAAANDPATPDTATPPTDEYHDREPASPM